MIDPNNPLGLISGTPLDQRMPLGDTYDSEDRRTQAYSAADSQKLAREAARQRELARLRARAERDPTPRLGRSIATGDYTTALSQRTPDGRSQRVLAPSEITGAGGIDSQQAGKYGFADQGGEPLGSMMDAIDEINRSSPNHLAFADRGGIKVRNVGGAVRRGALRPEDVQAAKQQQLGLSDAGIESTYRKALTDGNQDHARLLAERLYRRGADPSRLRSIQQEVASSQTLAERPQPLSAQELQDLTAHLDATRDDPVAWELIAAQLTAQGHGDIAAHVQKGIQQNETTRRARELETGRQGRHQDDFGLDVQREQRIGENQGRGLNLRESGQQQSASQFDRTLADRQAGREATFKAQMATQDRQIANDVHGQAERKIAGLSKALTNYSIRKSNTIGAEKSPEQEDAAVQQMIGDALGDDIELRDILLDAYKQQRSNGMAPVDAGDFALRRIYAAVGKSRAGNSNASYGQEPLAPLGSGAPADAGGDTEQDAAAKYLR